MMLQRGTHGPLCEKAALRENRRLGQEASRLKADRSPPRLLLLLYAETTGNWERGRRQALGQSQRNQSSFGAIKKTTFHETQRGAE